MKDLHNIASRSKEVRASNSSSSEVLELASWLREKYPGIDVDFVTYDSLPLTGKYLQDAEMESTVEKVFLADSTYKMNNLHMALYALLAVDGHGESQVVYPFFVTSEDKTTLMDMSEHFRLRTPKWS